MRINKEILSESLFCLNFIFSNAKSTEKRLQYSVDEMEYIRLHSVYLNFCVAKEYKLLKYFAKASLILLPSVK